MNSGMSSSTKIWPRVRARRSASTSEMCSWLAIRKIGVERRVYTAGKNKMTLDPFLPENNARLDAGTWTGHTGCVILAPHLCGLKKKDLALPHISAATERQKRDGMCWEHEDELYNGGTAFKLACRDARGVMVTLIASSRSSRSGATP